ncbi:glycosyl transferase family 2 [Rhodovulum imhoffii]|uniref:Glycosyl transferase family 2 n=1 Tax=Rhodovulum imhoffii TaxID=365340 RepID=A0A2T5BTE3_9RHOB|nr:glycosyltransferase family 2 protein [Rhodovulum imhoffii]MBK5934347.1 glycosyl transferase family 2 [Rhodovulum imhoffii]PTN02702.1 glycosyl transferase family 2 [Rhodovulum imhoffii]
MRFLAVLTVKNEAAFLLEWLAHHRAIGFTDFLVLSNDCEDSTDRMLDRLQEMGWLTHVPNPGPHDKGPQWQALRLASAHPLFAQADWVAMLDIDEFVNIHVEDGSLGALLSALPKASAITLTWRLFGNAGIVHYEDRPITAQFTRAAPRVMGWPWRAAMFKTLFRNDGLYAKLGVHRPRQPNRDRLGEARWFDGSGRPLGTAFHKSRVFNDFNQDNYKLVQLNHYALGAMESYVLKAARGRASHADLPMAMDYWAERNFCTDEDNSISATAPERTAQLDHLRSDVPLARLHEEAVAWRRRRFEELMTEEPLRALFGRLMLTPPARPLSPEASTIILKYGLRARKDQTM